MTPKLRALALVVPAALALALSACAGTTAPEVSYPDIQVKAVQQPCDDTFTGVEVVVDASVLDLADDPSVSWCVAADETIGAADALELAGISTEGTEEYGDQIVCRVNGVPSEDTDLVGADGTVVHETCASMPPAFAYWSLWTKPAGGEWGYAEEGLSTLQLEPGESVQLLFVLNDEPAAPSV